jgi:hypothetical protein
MISHYWFILSIIKISFGCVWFVMGYLDNKIYFLMRRDAFVGLFGLWREDVQTIA